MKYLNLKKSLFILPVGVFICGIVFIVSGQLFIMPWENIKTLELEDPRIVVKKEKRTLELFDGDKLIKTYKIALGSTPIGDKEIEGDGKTPEGDFYIFTKNAESSFYLSIGVSYPNIEDAKRGLENELITQEEHDEIVKAINEKKMSPQKTKLGGEVYIHGYGNLTDWTAGCVAMTNAEMKELYDAIPIGTSVNIQP
jgi:murein L,D-transpeptidase YafK